MHLMGAFMHLIRIADGNPANSFDAFLWDVYMSFLADISFVLFVKIVNFCLANSSQAAIQSEKHYSLVISAPSQSHQTLPSQKGQILGSPLPFLCPMLNSAILTLFSWPHSLKSPKMSAWTDLSQ